LTSSLAEPSLSMRRMYKRMIMRRTIYKAYYGKKEMTTILKMHQVVLVAMKKQRMKKCKLY
jgi:hypothetical protein